MKNGMSNSTYQVTISIDCHIQKNYPTSGCQIILSINVHILCKTICYKYVEFPFEVPPVHSRFHSKSKTLPGAPKFYPLQEIKKIEYFICCI